MGITGRKYFKRDILKRVNKTKLSVSEIITLAQKAIMNIYIKAKSLSVDVSLDDIKKMNPEEEYLFENELDKIVENKLLNKQYDRK